MIGSICVACRKPAGPDAVGQFCDICARILADAIRRDTAIVQLRTMVAACPHGHRWFVQPTWVTVPIPGFDDSHSHGPVLSEDQAICAACFENTATVVRYVGLQRPESLLGESAA